MNKACGPGYPMEVLVAFLGFDILCVLFDYSLETQDRTGRSLSGKTRCSSTDTHKASMNAVKYRTAGTTRLEADGHQAA